MRHLEILEPRQLLSTYYFAANGNDANATGSISHPFRSLARASTLHLLAGDQLLFAGGNTFTGNLSLDVSRVATHASPAGGANPIVISSYGSGPAVLRAATGAAISVHDLGSVKITDLVLTGPGRNVLGTTGIQFTDDQSAGTFLSNVDIDQVQISGFIDGIEFSAFPTDGDGKCGYHDVRITRSNIHDNGGDGIFFQGNFSQTATDYSFADVYIGYVISADNYHTVPGADDENGIEVSDTNGVTIEHSIAHDNGYSGNGEVGIWTWDCNRTLIQYCLSYRNRTGHTGDGDGFDLDGGDTNSIMQHNVSYENDGAGYALFQFPYARQFDGNIIRDNRSTNDGRKNSYGGIDIGNYGPGISSCQIYGNVVTTSPAPGASPSALQIETPITDIAVHNNIFITTGNAALLTVAAGQSRLSFSNDLYMSGQTAVIDWEGKTYQSLAAWKKASGQEG